MLTPSWCVFFQTFQIFYCSYCSTAWCDHVCKGRLWFMKLLASWHLHLSAFILLCLFLHTINFYHRWFCTLSSLLRWVSLGCCRRLCVRTLLLWVPLPLLRVYACLCVWTPWRAVHGGVCPLNCLGERTLLTQCTVLIEVWHIWRNIVFTRRSLISMRHISKFISRAIFTSIHYTKYIP